MKNKIKLIMIFYQIPFIFALILLIIFSIALVENLFMSYKVLLTLISFGFIGFLQINRIKYVRIIGGSIGLFLGLWLYKLGLESTHTNIVIYASIAIIIFYSSCLLYFIFLKKSKL